MALAQPRPPGSCGDIEAEVWGPAVLPSGAPSGGCPNSKEET